MTQAGKDASTWVALLRGINVGGAGRLPMAEFRQDLERLGLEDVQTYIQSGNAVFRSEAEDEEGLAETIAAAVERRHGFQPRVLVMSASRFEEVIEANPFPAAVKEPNRLHVFFLERQPGATCVSRLEEVASPTERVCLSARALYLHAPDGIGRSKLASRVESLLDVPATARNWRTITRIRDMVGGQGGERSGSRRDITNPA